MGAPVKSRVAILGLAAVLGACAGAAPSPTPGVPRPPSAETPGASPASATPSAATTATSSAAPPSAWQTVLARIESSETVSRDDALAAFALAVGPVPGVERPSGPATEPGEIRSGSGAIRWVLGHWDELTAEQQAAVVADIAPGGRSLEVGATTSQVEAPAAPAGSNVSLETFANAVARAEELIADGAHLDRPLGMPITVTFNDVEVKVTDAAALAYTYPLGPNDAPIASGTPTRCGIFVNPAGQAEQLGAMLNLAAHETFHCFQLAIIGDAGLWSSATEPKWVVEGQAEWAGATIEDQLYGPAQPDPLWSTYLKYPDAMLFDRSYSAIGFYAQLAQSKVDVWKVIAPMLRAFNSEPAFHAAADSAGDRFLDAWASGFFREANQGPDWDITGPGITDDEADVPFLGISNGGVKTIAASRYTNQVHRLLSDADVIHASVTGHARLKSGRVDAKSLADDYFCTRGGGDCTCPPGSSREGPPPVALATPAQLALTGGPDGVTGSIQGMTLAEFCGARPTAARCSIGIPAGEYSGTLGYAATAPSLTHDGSGSIRFKVDAKGAVTGSWDLAYVGKVFGDEGTGTVTDGVVSGTPRELHLHGTNVVTTFRGTGATVPWPDTPLTVQPVCDGHVVAAWVNPLNGGRQEISIDARPTVSP